MADLGADGEFMAACMAAAGRVCAGVDDLGYRHWCLPSQVEQMRAVVKLSPVADLPGAPLAIAPRRAAQSSLFDADVLD